MQKKSVWYQVAELLFLLVMVNSIGFIGSLYMTPETLNWYHQLNISPLTPPDWVFGMVWSVLFFLMALSMFWVWGRASPCWFAIQLLLNMLWSFSFFYLRSPLLAEIVLIGLIFALIMNIYSFGKVSRISGLLLIPTFVWSLFALYLNTYIIL